MRILVNLFDRNRGLTRYGYFRQEQMLRRGRLNNLGVSIPLSG